MTGDSELLTVRQVATRLKMNEETVRRWLKSKRLHGFMPGGHKLGWRIPKSELDRYLSEVAGGPTLTPEPREPQGGAMTGAERAREG